MSELGRALGFDAVSLGASIAFAIQGTLILFFVLAPLLGGVLHSIIGKRPNWYLVWSLAVLITLVGNFALSFVLRVLIPTENASDLAIALLSSIASLAVGLLISRYVGWVIADPDTPTWMKVMETMSDAEMNPIDRRRKEWRERKGKRNKF